MRESTSTISSKGQVTIPAEVRRHLGVATSDKVAFAILDSGKVELRPAQHSVAGLRGIVPALPGSETVDFEDQIEEALAEGADRIVRGIEGQ